MKNELIATAPKVSLGIKIPLTIFVVTSQIWRKKNVKIANFQFERRTSLICGIFGAHEYVFVRPEILTV